MKDHAGCFRGFVHFNEAWYAQTMVRGDGLVDEISIGFYHPDGGTSGEFAVEWIELSGKLTPMLRAFNDSWNALGLMTDLLARMADLDSQIVTPEAFCKMLLDLGFKDKTLRAPPGDPKVKELMAERERLQAQLEKLDRQIAGTRR